MASQQTQSAHSGSIFSQKLDRAAFTAYFLGAIVPLAALGALAQRYVLPSLSEGRTVLGLIGLLVSIGMLSLASFFVLRKTTRQSLGQMDRNNERLASLLAASGQLAGAHHTRDAAATAARCSLSLTGAGAAFVLSASASGEAPKLLESAGEQAASLYQRFGEPLVEMSLLAIGNGRPALRGPAPRRPAMAVVPLAGDPDPLGALAVIHASSSDAFAPGELHALTTLAGLASVALANADLRHAQRNFFSHMTDLLVSALDAHLGYHGGHGTRVAQYANRIGREMRLDDSILQNLHFAAQLHDIGMLKFEQAMQKTPKACEKHAVIGARMLGQIRLWEGVAPIVLHHHEWMDGTGYPEGLAGDAIPLEARIIAVCDAFDSMTSSTSYKVAMSLEAAVQELEEGAGTQFDPDAVRVFVDLAQRGVIEVLADASG